MPRQICLILTSYCLCSQKSKLEVNTQGAVANAKVSYLMHDSSGTYDLKFLMSSVGALSTPVLTCDIHHAGILNSVVCKRTPRILSSIPYFNVVPALPEDVDTRNGLARDCHCFPSFPSAAWDYGSSRGTLTWRRATLVHPIPSELESLSFQNEKTGAGHR